jgi:hypothetical protein
MPNQLRYPECLMKPAFLRGSYAEQVTGVRTALMRTAMCTLDEWIHHINHVIHCSECSSFRKVRSRYLYDKMLGTALRVFVRTS